MPAGTAIQPRPSVSIHTRNNKRRRPNPPASSASDASQPASPASIAGEAASAAAVSRPSNNASNARGARPARRRSRSPNPRILVRDSRRREREAAQNARARPRQQIPPPPPPTYQQATQAAPQRAMQPLHLDFSNPAPQGAARRHDLAGNLLVRRGQRINPTADIVQVIPRNEVDGTPFNIHQNLLEAHLNLIPERLQQLAQDGPKTLIVPNVDCETMMTFCEWLYTEELAIHEIDDAERGISEPAAETVVREVMIMGRQPHFRGPRSTRVHHRLVNLYIFARKWCTQTFQNVVHDQLKQFVHKLQLMDQESGPTVTVIKSLHDTIGTNNPYGESLADFFIQSKDFHQNHVGILATLPSWFLAMVVSRVARERRRAQNPQGRAPRRLPLPVMDAFGHVRNG